MASGLTCVGYLWSALSLVAAVAVCVGFYLPYWLKGTLSLQNLKFTSNHFIAPPGYDGNEIMVTSSYGDANQVPTFFCPFRRCNYWTAGGLKEQCGRYTDFDDIPSAWWRVCTICVGTGGALALLVAFVSLSSCCAADVVSRSSGRALGLCQVVAAVLVCLGCILFPLGWDSREVKAACGNGSDRFVLGSCTIEWAYYTVIGGACLLYICASISTISGRPIRWTEIKKTHKTISV